MRDLLAFCEAEQSWLRNTVETLVRIESPTNVKAAVDACGAAVARALEEIGGRVEKVPHPAAGDHIKARFGEGSTRVLFIGHFDTVWDVGTLARMPLIEREGKLFGPGIFDMKTGLAIAMQSLRALRHTSWPDGLSVTCLFTSDEETGSDTSRALIEDEARRADAAFVFEPAMTGGALKTARKGVGEFEIRVKGVSAHAGIAPGEGASAIHALAKLVAELESLNDPASGVSVNVGVIEGGSRSNVIAEHARADVDVRVVRMADAPRVEAALRNLSSADPRIAIEVLGAIDRPPFERTEKVAALFERARRVAGELGFALGEAATGGASDGNFTGALGVPTLDGLGAVGGGAHALDEHVELAPLPARAALAAGLLRDLMR